MSERELFELEYKKQMHTFNDAFCRYENGGYMNEKVSIAWGIWQASANRQGYKLVPCEPDEKQWGGIARHLGRYMQMHNRYCPKTLKKYFDRFIGEPPEWLTKEVGNWDSEHAFATADLPVFIYKAMIGAVE